MDVSRHGLEDIVTFIHAPMTAVPNDLKILNQELWYDSAKIATALQDEQKFDLIIVDGPFGGSTPFARYSAIPFLENRLSNTYGVFLDDAQREDELQISERWAQILKIKPQFMERYTYFRSNKSFDTLPFMISNF
ncbi:hypothetical protein DFQ11_102723 [Winogradskyella epiphytica]|uniref:Uncharacterized protein n=1 Tax=Winogradskyella epiphytica TaxID=262005 RepID=A0A2V4WYQ1_9FLAO|nr:hypothetical protein [Winogradskyella epiphytica]PYE82142.1 hypothetical protein DFQ11_102723 [Winogradskyella epiphytica]GGW60268.1 hypothetical protein GCM10008085_09540 [Winogradskyella epiphytica]